MNWEAFRHQLRSNLGRCICNERFVLDPFNDVVIEQTVFGDRVEWRYFVRGRLQYMVLTLTRTEHLAAMMGIIHLDELRVTVESAKAIRHHVTHTSDWMHMAAGLPAHLGGNCVALAA